MTAYYSKRAKAMLEHKFKSHPNKNPKMIKIFGNYSDTFGIEHHMVARYVYCKRRDNKEPTPKLNTDEEFLNWLMDENMH